MVGAVILIHGFIGPFRLPALADDLGCPVISPDLAGYGAEVGASPMGLPRHAEQVVALIDAQSGPVDLIGHSVGGAVAMMAADQRPDAVRGVVSVEGNFSLDDAFWSAHVGRMSEQEARQMLAGYQEDPAGWLARSGMVPTSANLEWARAALAFQNSETLRTMGRSVVDHTGGDAWPILLRRVFARTAVSLVAGARSRSSWNTPDWALAAAINFDVVPDVGHMPMIERPDLFRTLLRRLLTPLPSPLSAEPV